VSWSVKFLHFPWLNGHRVMATHPPPSWTCAPNKCLSLYLTDIAFQALKVAKLDFLRHRAAVSVPLTSGFHGPSPHLLRACRTREGRHPPPALDGVGDAPRCAPPSNQGAVSCASVGTKASNNRLGMAAELTPSSVSSPKNLHHPQPSLQDHPQPRELTNTLAIISEGLDEHCSAQKARATQFCLFS